MFTDNIVVDASVSASAAAAVAAAAAEIMSAMLQMISRMLQMISRNPTPSIHNANRMKSILTLIATILLMPMPPLVALAGVYTLARINVGYLRRGRLSSVILLRLHRLASSRCP